ncbi:restriction endonuclease subunit M [Elizabethkingia anophelis]|uniref:restriction endonuclease subunit M n=1 Tax=Elizabethkingia anophelis TaxID=1117645 RepID=UPI0009787F6D|nr:restriction endonuclease subunit M [Elizabethkingia anophelis]
MQVVIDILENEIIEKYPNILEILLRDQTTRKNIFWATDNYEHLGDLYRFNSEILFNSITGENGNIIMPRVYKDKVLQLSRSKEMAEVFTPSWICNAQNNTVDNSWFGRENVFNKEVILENGTKSWETTKEKIVFPKGKTWQDYILDIRLEITCGEAPYLVSRYDTTTGLFIDIENRIGLLDRKLRVINENINAEKDWIKATKTAYQNIYGFEWQGDSLLLAREALLITFIENYKYKFETDPTLEAIKNIAQIISWNIWQMDGLKGVVPNSCKDEIIETVTFFDTQTEVQKCKGCEKQNIKSHNGIYCNIMNWEVENPIRFIDLLEK